MARRRLGGHRAQCTGHQRTTGGTGHPKEDVHNVHDGPQPKRIGFVENARWGLAEGVGGIGGGRADVHVHAYQHQDHGLDVLPAAAPALPRDAHLVFGNALHL